MPLLTAWNPNTGRGIYYAVHDPEPYTKRVRLDKHFGGNGYLSLSYVAEDSERIGNSQALSGKAIWRLYEGDWYDAAMIYRDWVGTNAHWMPKMDAQNERYDTPEWMHDIGFWSHWSVDDQDAATWTQPLLDLQRKVGVPLAVHLYRWHKIPFDTCYPHYFPVQGSTLEGIRILQAAGIHVMPYINARLWDVHDGEDFVKYTGMEPPFTFEKEGIRSATMGWDGKIYKEAYVSRRLNGERVRLNGACLSQDSWLDVVEGLCERMYSELGVDGVYLDQMSGCSYASCYNPAHGHPLGEGGVWYMNGAQKLMKRLDALRKRMGKAGIYTSEQNAEVYANILDGQLVWHWSSGGLIPFYSAVYSDRIELFGRNFPISPKMVDDDIFYARITFAEQLIFGDQMGWHTTFLVNEKQREADLAFYTAAIRMRYKHRAYYTHGQLLRPPKVSCDAPAIVVHHTSDYNTGALFGNPITAALRGHPTDGTKLLVVVNISDQSLPCELQCDLPDGEIQLEGGLECSATVRDGKIALTMPPLSVVMSIIGETK